VTDVLVAHSSASCPCCSCPCCLSSASTSAFDISRYSQAAIAVLLLLLLLQVRESASCLLHVAKQMGCATFLVRGGSVWLGGSRLLGYTHTHSMHAMHAVDVGTCCFWQPSCVYMFTALCIASLLGSVTGQHSTRLPAGCPLPYGRVLRCILIWPIAAFLLSVPPGTCSLAQFTAIDSCLREA
jgi:hypothetical protein